MNDEPEGMRMAMENGPSVRITAPRRRQVSAPVDTATENWGAERDCMRVLLLTVLAERMATIQRINTKENHGN